MYTGRFLALKGFCRCTRPFRVPNGIAFGRKQLPCAAYATSIKEQKTLKHKVRQQLCNPTREHNFPDMELPNHGSFAELFNYPHKSENATSPIQRLEAIAKSTDKSIKLSYLLLCDKGLRQKYTSLLSAVTDSLCTSTKAEDILTALSAIAKICQRQDVFLELDETKISLHHDENVKAKSCASVLPDEAVGLFTKCEEILSVQGLSGISNSSLAMLIWSGAVTQQGSVNLHVKLKRECLHRHLKDFSDTELCQIVESFGDNSLINTQDLFKTFCLEILQRGLVGFHTHELPVLLFSFARQQQQQQRSTISPRLYHALKKDFMTRNLTVLSPVDICRVFWSLVKIKRDVKSTDLVVMLEKTILQHRARWFGDRGLAVILWSLTELNHFSKDIFTLLMKDICLRNHRRVTAHDISIWMWSFAKFKLRFDSRVVFALMDKELHRRGFSEFSPSELAMTAWSFAEAEQGTRATLIELKKEILARNLKDLAPIGLSQIVWSFAKVKSKLEVNDLFGYFGTEIVTGYDIRRFSVRQLALILWSFSVCEHTPALLFKELQKEASRKGLQGCNNAILCQLLFSLAEGGDLIDGALHGKVVHEMLHRGVGSFHNLQLATAVWSIAEFDDRESSPELVLTLEQEIQHRDLKTYMPADLCRIMLAFSKFKISGKLNCNTVLGGFVKELSRRDLSEFSCGELAMVLMALTEANELTPGTLRLLKSEILCRNTRGFSATHLCILARCSANQDAEELYAWIEEEVISRSVSAFTPAEMIALLWVFTELSRGQGICSAIKDQLLTRNFHGYTAKDIGKMCEVMQENGIQTSEISSKFIA